MTDKSREQETGQPHEEGGQTGETQVSETQVSETGPQTEQPKEVAKEIGGRKGPEPTRYGDWEKGGICSDF